MDDRQIRILRLSAGGYTCSQIIIQLGLDMRGQENPLLVRSMAGLAYGCGDGRASCGVLTGGCCLLALYAGNGSAGKGARIHSEDLPLLLGELTGWFEKKVGGPYGGITCLDITGKDGPPQARQRCGSLLAETFDQAMAILVSHGVDPHDPD
jgi:hypothetical protein